MEERVDSENERRRKVSDAATRIERDDLQERRWPRQNALAAATAVAMLILVGGCNLFTADPTAILVDTGDVDVTPPPSGWAYIPPWTFMMGSLPGEVGYWGPEEAQHLVTLTRGFLL